MDDPLFEMLRRELAFRELENHHTAIDRDLALRRQAEYLEKQFIAKMNQFVALWSALVREYNEKRTFNIKLVGEVAKAFRDLENTEGWPKQKRNIR